MVSDVACGVDLGVFHVVFDGFKLHSIVVSCKLCKSWTGHLI